MRTFTCIITLTALTDRSLTPRSNTCMMPDGKAAKAAWLAKIDKPFRKLRTEEEAKKVWLSKIEQPTRLQRLKTKTAEAIRIGEPITTRQASVVDEEAAKRAWLAKLDEPIVP